MSVSIREIDGVESVTVSLNQGAARITLKPGNAIGLDRVRDVVKRKGFTPREATVVAVATVSRSGDGYLVDVIGIAERYRVADTPERSAASPELSDLVGVSVRVKGVVGVPDGDREPTIELLTVEPSRDK